MNPKEQSEGTDKPSEGGLKFGFPFGKSDAAEEKITDPNPYPNSHPNIYLAQPLNLFGFVSRVKY